MSLLDIFKVDQLRSNISILEKDRDMLTKQVKEIKRALFLGLFSSGI